MAWMQPWKFLHSPPPPPHLHDSPWWVVFGYLIVIFRKYFVISNFLLYTSVFQVFVERILERNIMEHVDGVIGSHGTQSRKFRVPLIDGECVFDLKVLLCVSRDLFMGIDGFLDLIETCMCEWRGRGAVEFDIYCFR